MGKEQTTFDNSSFKNIGSTNNSSSGSSDAQSAATDETLIANQLIAMGEYKALAKKIGAPEEKKALAVENLDKMENIEAAYSASAENTTTLSAPGTQTDAPGNPQKAKLDTQNITPGITERKANVPSMAEMLEKALSESKELFVLGLQYGAAFSQNARSAVRDAMQGIFSGAPSEVTAETTASRDAIKGAIAEASKTANQFVQEKISELTHTAGQPNNQMSLETAANLAKISENLKLPFTDLGKANFSLLVSSVPPQQTANANKAPEQNTGFSRGSVTG